MFNQKGITLMALVITIIVILILAGVATYSGIEAINNTKYTKFTTELKIMQTYVNKWYEDIKPESDNETKDTFKSNIETKFVGADATNAKDDSTAVQTLQTAIPGITEQEISNYYLLKSTQKERLGVEGVEQDVLVNVLNRKLVSYLGMNYKGVMYYTLDDLDSVYNVDYDSTILNNNDETKPTISVKGKSVYYGETAKGAKYKFTFGITQGAPYVDKGTVYYSKLNDSNQTIGWKSTTDTELLVDREGKYRFYYKDAAGNVSDSVDYVVEPKATLIDGSNFNVKMKSLSGTVNPEVSTENTNITEFKIANTRPSDTIINNPDNKVSTNESQFDVYMWFENGIIWLWSEENWIYLNSSCSNMFRLLKSAENIDLSFFNTSHVTNMSRTFGLCNNLKKLDLSNFYTNNVTNMSNMFKNCSSLTSLDLSSFNTTKVTTMQEMFRGCSGLLDLNISNFDTREVTTMTYMFYGCSNLTNLDSTNFYTSKVTDMSSMFSYCKLLKTINMSSFDTSNVTSMSRMFNGCNSITNLDLLNFNTSNVTDMNFMFNNCNELTNLDLSSFNTSNVKGMHKMFCNCNKLERIYVSNAFSVSSLTDEQVPDQPQGHYNSNYIFYASTLLLGGSGTTYNSNHVDADYAHIDGGPSNPGYFTLKTNNI